MVTKFAVTFCEFGYLLAEEPAGPVIERLDPLRRATVIMALLALVLTGLLLITCTMLGANWVRRMARYKPGERRTGDGAEAVARNRRLRESLHVLLPDANTNETVHVDASTKETKVDP